MAKKTDIFILKIIVLFTFFTILSCEKNKYIIEPISDVNIPNTPFPENSSAQIPLNITLSWYCEDAIKYTIYLDTVNPPIKVFKKDIVEPHLDMTDLVYNTNYYWSVTAHLECGISVSSEVWRFTTKNISVDSTSSINFNFPNIRIIAEYRWLEYYIYGDTTAIGIDTFNTYIDNSYLPQNIPEFENLIYSNDTIYFGKDIILWNKDIQTDGWMTFNFNTLKLNLYYHYYQYYTDSEGGIEIKELYFCLKNIPFSVTANNNIQANINFMEFSTNIDLFSYNEENIGLTSCIGGIIHEGYLTAFELLNFDSNSEMLISIIF
ncbi:MAG: hypothetical protein KAR38_04825 [Calditrichia bacterium]|nr:hypothetical protein [Calditrichia bacterium]